MILNWQSYFCAVNRDAYADLIGGSAAHSAYSDSTPFGNDTITAYTYDEAKAAEIFLTMPVI